jgi:hypothetical protein
MFARPCFAYSPTAALRRVRDDIAKSDGKRRGILATQQDFTRLLWPSTLVNAVTYISNLLSNCGCRRMVRRDTSMLLEKFALKRLR